MAAMNIKARIKSKSLSATISGPDRSAASFVTRGEMIAAQSAQASRDQKFNDFVANGDRCRDAGSWGDAEYNYWRALQLYPFQPGYRVQYAHMLKERKKFGDAELHYRSALAMGFPLKEVQEHLSFSAARNGYTVGELPTANLAVQPMDAPPTVCDIDLLGYALLHRAAINSDEALQFIRKCRTNREVAVSMMAGEQFTRANLPFFEILRK